MNKINKILEGEDFELQQLLREIMAKNGLPPQDNIGSKIDIEKK